ncbi:hypothetical protein DC522_23615 [Microvirga sp. KLBC 81]|nr:hypothetical protein DC522_23615 [Microvirga sp. KLBC 81]
MLIAPDTQTAVTMAALAGVLAPRAEPKVRVSDPKGHASETWSGLPCKTMRYSMEEASDPKVHSAFGFEALGDY